MRRLVIRCPAKINLTLEILGRRPDGYHELRTIFHAVSLYDEVQLWLAERDSFCVSGWPDVPADETNLCWRALQLFRKHWGLNRPVGMKLHKNIPSQAGLGGGSSDAAGVLVGLTELFSQCVSPQEIPPQLQAARSHPAVLHELAAQLGSDVPFFLYGGAMLGQGRGEILSPCPPLQQGAFVLVKPSVSVCTKEAYQLLSPALFTGGEYTARMFTILHAAPESPLLEVARSVYNIFTMPVEQRWPEIAQVRRRLQQRNAQAAVLCGSGAAVLGLYEEEAQAKAVAQELAQEGFWAVAAAPRADGLQVAWQ